MAQVLNFHNVQKHYLNIVLADEKNTELMVGTPTKGVMDDLLVLQGALNEISEDSDNMEATEDLYRVTAKILSRNKAGIKITKEALADLFDFEDIVIFFNAYMEFITEVTSSKN